jgi:CO/xanthine dehydrogenase FAD-binding subunit
MREVLLPESLDELWSMLEDNPGARVYAGGTDLLPRMRRGDVQPPALICLERTARLKGVHDEGDTVFISAATTFTEILEHPLLHEHFPVLRQAIEKLASPPIRNMATLGGNIVNASPAGDTLPPLYCLGADIEIRSRSEGRKVPLDRFIKGPGLVDLQPYEIITGALVKKRPEFNVSHFEKVGRRKAQACSVASLAALMDISSDGTIRSARLAWGSVGPTVVRSDDMDAALRDKPLSPGTLTSLQPLVTDTVTPISDIRASAEYRSLVAAKLLYRLLDHSRP